MVDPSTTSSVARMNRSSLDKLVSWVGLALAALLVGAGALLQWGFAFANTTVKEQLSEQNISFSPDLTEEANPKIYQWAGKQVTDGNMAYGYANYYIAEHMAGAVAGWNAGHPDLQVGETYSEVSGAFMGLTQDPAADPAVVAELAQLRQTMFMGDTLRGLLMTTYAFWMFGQIAQIASFAAFVGAGVFLILAVLGFRHAKAANAEA